ncbi:baseplate J/gp47 family protein [Elstera cyanobacteriorum]|uniref:baseplate J/gp47 family protein n=1 Tax=Elstera cyanobacteriorum TaxID=2022747 RepID=UPI00235518EF|nr:baseplate J/gp47 family protein [Elstera cyanobacteriorum]MCK6442266.1 baseplate J/gp47 family protein [Elstera cyanobacteriorum]
MPTANSLGLIRPSIDDLMRQAEAEINARLPGADSRLRWNNLSVIAAVLAGGLHEVYGYLDGIAEAVLPDRATGDVLERHAAWRGLLRKPATPAAGTVLLTGISGAVVPAGARLLRGDRAEYAVEASALIGADGTGSVAVEALTLGAAGNAAPGTEVRFTSGVAGVASVASVGPLGLGGGAELETDESLRARLRARVQLAPHGGAAHDYIAWALEVPGVTRAWVRVIPPCQVRVLFTMDESYPDGIPLPQDVANVQAHIETRRPVTAMVIVKAPNPVPVDFIVQSLVPESNAAIPDVRTAIIAELKDMILRDGAPGSPLLVSHVREAISIAAGEWDHVPLSPAANVPIGPEQLPVFGSIAWV